MSLIAKSSGDGGSFEIAPEDTHMARCYRVLDLGTHHDEKYDKNQHKIMISWELPEALMSSGEYEGQPFTIHRRYTVSLHEKANLRHDLEAWRGKKFTEKELEGFLIANLLSKTCYINVVHSEDGKYANIGSILKLPKGVVCPDAVNPTVVLDLDDFNEEVFGNLSDNMKKTIMESQEYKLMKDGAPTSSQGERNDGGEEDWADDDIAF